MPLDPGTRLGSYEISGLLGAGGMGEVYRGRDSRLGRDVAIKVLPADLARDKDALARFEREAKTASALNHPHIVHIYEIGVAETPAGPTHFIAMELVEGETLRARLKGGARWKGLLEPLAQAADALARAHKAGIVHRDLKPENVMLTPDGYPKVVDFGLAKLTETGGDPTKSTATPSLEGRTRSGMIVGTPSCMSPEQAQGKPVDQRSDIFSFGCILYEAATGSRPFTGSSSVATLHAIVYDEPPPIESLTGDAPAELRRIVRKCLAKDPEQRYQTIKDVANDLRELAREATPHAGSVPTMAVAPEPEPGRRRTSAGRWVVVAVLAAVGVAGLTAALIGRAGPAAVPSASGAAPAGLKVEKLTSRGEADHPAISPDGRYLAYSSMVGGRTTILLRDLAEKTETQPLAGTEIESVHGIAFARDGQALYSSMLKKGGARGLYRIPLIGGEPRLLHTGGWGAQLSPDEKHVAFKRDTQDGGTALFLANVDTGTEREIAALGDGFGWSPDGVHYLFSRDRDDRSTLFLADVDGTSPRQIAVLPKVVRDAWWRPDGARILCALAQNDRDAQLFDLDLAAGTTRPVGDRQWRQINALYWLPDGTAFVLNEVGTKEGNALYRVSYPEGREERIPADAQSYWGLGMAADGTRLVSVQSVVRSDLVVSSDPERSVFHEVVSGTGLRYRFSWTADGRIVYSSNESGTYDLYLVDADGSNRKALFTDRAGNELEPAASPDGRYIVFVSDRSGERGLYRINRDGTGLKSLTPAPVPTHADCDPRVSLDNRWVLYRHRDNGSTLWRVPIDGGTPALVKGTRPSLPGGIVEQAFGGSTSPDGKSVAFLYFTFTPGVEAPSPIEIAVSSLDGGIAKRLPYLERHQGGISDNQRTQWSRDGATLYYNVPFEQGARALWKRALSGGPAVQVTRFDDPVTYFDWSFDGRMLAVSRSSKLSDVVLITNFH